MRFILIFTLIIMFSVQAQASQGMSSANCPLKGIVQKIELREEAGQGMSDGMTLKYIDVTIELIKANKDVEIPNDPFCQHEKIKKLQMHPPALGLIDPSLPNVGDCISGYSRFMADGNFKSGNWLTVSETLPKVSCKEDDL